LARAKEIQAEKRAVKRQDAITKLEDTKALEAKALEGVFDVLVIDPPWDMKKIERDVRPNQVEFDYPTMTQDELKALELPAADDCHVWLWTTHKHLPRAFDLLTEWGLKYVCTFVWHKPGGFQPVGLPQYNCEFALYARKGSPQFIDTKALPVCFSAGRGAHSEKPEEFYDVVRRVTAGRRADMFNRRAIDGFEGWGLEAAS
jgi:N6-adenosine-specific RNA methylase IME4